MTKIIALAFAAMTLVACNDAETETETDTATVDNTTTTTTSAYTPADGDVTYRENKVRVMRNGDWVDADEDIELEDGVVVRKNGRVVKDGREVELEDGQIVNRTGRFFDRTGQAIENAWDATKEGVKDAGRAVEDAVDGDNRRENN